MSNTKLFIPKKIKVGFNERNDTYTKKLAYVIYYDNKGVLRKETSWESWRDKKIEPMEFENVPTSGFVLNKTAGGTRGHSWEQRQTYTRVYDPRGFEFEITIPNLLFILQECDSSKGKGLEGEFVYSWDGKDLVLLPAIADEYQQSILFTETQSLKVSSKDLKEGCVYINSKMEELIYLGKYRYADRETYRYNDKLSDKKMFIFLPVDDGTKQGSWRYWNRNYFILNGLTSIKKMVSDVPVDNFSTILQNFLESPYSSEYIGIEYFPLNNEEINELLNLKNNSSKTVYIESTKEPVCIMNTEDGYREYHLVKENYWFSNTPRYSFYADLWYDSNGSIKPKYVLISEGDIKTKYGGRYAIYENGSKLNIRVEY